MESDEQVYQPRHLKVTRTHRVLERWRSYRERKQEQIAKLIENEAEELLIFKQIPSRTMRQIRENWGVRKDELTREVWTWDMPLAWRAWSWLLTAELMFGIGGRVGWGDVTPST